MVKSLNGYLRTALLPFILPICGTNSIFEKVTSSSKKSLYRKELCAGHSGTDFFVGILEDPRAPWRGAKR